MSWRRNRLYSSSACRSAREMILFFCFYNFPGLSFLCLHVVMTSWRDVMMSQNSLFLYQFVDVLKWWYTFISVDISVAGFQAIMVYVFACCLHVIAWRHDVTKITTWRQETNCLHLSLQMWSRADSIFLSVISWVAELNLVIVIVFAWWNNVTKWRHDVIKHALPISACRCGAREMFRFLFLWYSGLPSSNISSILYLHMWSCHKVTLWRHGMTIWRHKTHSIYIRVWSGYRQMIRCPCIYGCLKYSIRKCRCLIRRCHSISTGTMTLLYAVTSWSWRPVTISQISFHSS